MSQLDDSKCHVPETVWNSFLKFYDITEDENDSLCSTKDFIADIPELESHSANLGKEIQGYTETIRVG